MNIQTYDIETCMGKVTSFGEQLTFLSESEQNEFDQIGYTGKDSSKQKSSFEKFLNGLGKGNFKVKKTKFDSGDFMEKYNIVRVVT